MERSYFQPVILFLDDDDNTPGLVHIKLGLAGIRSHSVTKRSDAWNVAIANEFDLYLLDGKLPHGDSFQLCADLREFAPEKPIVFYSELVSPTDRQRAFDAGASAFLKKPFDGDLGAELFALMRTGHRALGTVASEDGFTTDVVRISNRANTFRQAFETDDNTTDHHDQAAKS